MRVEKSIKNGVASIFSYGFSVLLGFIAQKIFIITLGKQYLGINGLLTNVISMLSVVELGIGNAIIFHLYRPIADKDKDKIKSLMNFYKKCYRVIAAIVLMIGLLIIPFLRFIVPDVSISENLIVIYLLFLADTVISYLLSYKRSMLFANQESYYIEFIHIGYLFLMNGFNVAVLLLTQNYYLFLCVKIFFRFAENFIISEIVNRKYSYINGNYAKLDDTTLKDIKKKVKALINHKIGGFVVLGSDNIIISAFLNHGVELVGLYSNYYMVINSLQNILGKIISACTASTGDLLTENNLSKNYQTFKKIEFINFVLCTFGASGLIILMEPFIKLWVGESFLLPTATLFILSANFFLNLYRAVFQNFNDAGGIYFENRYVPFAECIVNIVASIFLSYLFGITGVFMGTFLSNLILFAYSFPKYTYKPLFSKNYISYFFDIGKHCLVGFIIICICYLISKCITVSNVWFEFSFKLIIVLIIPNLFLCLYSFRNKEFAYFKNLFCQILQNKLRR